ncbi:hypothetical protein GFO_3006 [Christiangramia forsetii KT0803]|uniref:Uncharacterized protein n=1 Tax=Christiangramia forsetii (strain DSM 17595 / CGMCC 1.15422 / KT0803) TaxID=411154 RepID=A0M5Q6_CHRFK|nr:hypothetical protein GFO_3006 [Christiangramia forsetii KT0803]
MNIFFNVLIAGKRYPFFWTLLLCDRPILKIVRYVVAQLNFMWLLKRVNLLNSGLRILSNKKLY